MDSYHNMKRSSGAKVKENLSKSYSEKNHTISADSALFDPVALKARRRRSSSLNDSIFSLCNGHTHPDHTPILADNASSSRETNGKVRHGFSYTVRQPSADNNEPLPKNCTLQNKPTFQNGKHRLAIGYSRFRSMDDLLSSTISEGGSNLATSHSSTGSESDCVHVAPPTYRHIHPPEAEVESLTKKSSSPDYDYADSNNRINIVKMNDETDSGFGVGSRMGREEEEGLSLNDITFSLKHRRSKSAESLLKDERFGMILMRGGYCSLDDSEEERDDDSSFLLDSVCSGFSDGLSDLDLSTSVTPTLTHLAEQGGGVGSHSNTAMCSPAACTERSLAQTPDAPLLPFSSRTPTGFPSSCPDTSMDTPMGLEAEGSNWSTKMGRSKSQNSKRTRRLSRKNYFLRKPKSFAGSETDGECVAADYTDMLSRFQMASLGCDLGVWSCGMVRQVLCESVTNTELDNHTLSLEREVD